nr:hypothetical protein [Tanacetum cinerariifolium]
MSRDVITVGSTMRIPFLYRDEYSQWRERFMNYLEEQTDDEAMINSIQNGDQPFPVMAQVNETAKDLWDALERQMRGSEYVEQDRKAAILYEYETFKATKGEQLLDTYLRYLQYGTLMRQTKNLIDINIDALYNILKQNKGDVNDALGYKKKAIVVTSDPLALVAKKTNVNIHKKNVEVQSESEESDDEDISDLKKITVLSDSDESSSSAKETIAEVAYYTSSNTPPTHIPLRAILGVLQFYSKPTNNNLRTSSTSHSANKKQEFVKSDVLLAEDQAWMESSSDFDQEINANMVFMAQIEKVLSESDESYSSAEETIAKVLYDEKVIGLGYTLMFLIHSDEALDIEKFKRAIHNKIEFAYDYGNLNASYVNEKIIFSYDYFQEIINPDFEKIDSPFQQTSSLKSYVPNVILEKIIIDLEDEVTSNTLHNAIMEVGGKDRPPMLAPDKVVPVSKGSPETTTKTYMENYKNVSQDIRDQLNAEAKAVQIILTGIDNDIYSTFDAYPNACEM